MFHVKRLLLWLLPARRVTVPPATGCKYGINDECRCAEGGRPIGGF
jgi:hypothetical protein